MTRASLVLAAIALLLCALAPQALAAPRRVQQATGGDAAMAPAPAGGDARYVVRTGPAYVVACVPRARRARAAAAPAHASSSPLSRC